MTFIGPGSEWFWSAVSGLITVVTFVAIYRQLRIMRSGSAFDQLDAFERELDSERMVRYQLEVLIALQDGVDPLDLPRASASGIWRFWEKTGALARRGHLDPQLLSEGSGTSVIEWWRYLEPYAKRARSAGSTDYLANFEWLAKTMAKILERDGTEPWFDDPALSRQVRIDGHKGRLRIEEALRAVGGPSPEGQMLGKAMGAPAPPVIAAGDNGQVVTGSEATKPDSE